MTFLKINKFTFYIFLASIAMFGLICMQVLWVNNAYHLKSDLFDHRINVALKSVVNQMIEQKQSTHKNIFHVHYCKLQQQDIIEHIDSLVLDSIIKQEFQSLHIEKDYEYAVYKKLDSTLVLGNYKQYASLIPNSPYNISLTCVSSDNSFHLGVVFPQKKFFILKQILFWLFVNLILFILIGLSYYKIIGYYIKLQRLSTIKADFINNLTHEFKTPLATISIAGEMLKKENMACDREKYEKYTDIILSENTRLKLQVDQILQISSIEKNELPFKKEHIHVHDIIYECIQHFNLVIENKKALIETILNAEKTIIVGDKTHFRNIISNLIDNALKYSKCKPHIIIKSYNKGNFIFLEIIDNGIGISQAHIKNIFHQFYRVPTGNIHNIKGFGLGLFYVKSVLDLMKGTINISSEVGKGTTFIIKLIAHN